MGEPMAPGLNGPYKPDSRGGGRRKTPRKRRAVLEKSRQKADRYAADSPSDPLTETRRTAIKSVNLTGRTTLGYAPADAAEVVLKCLSRNCPSLSDKLRDIKQSACLKQLSIIALTGTWPAPDVSDAEIWIDGYSTFRADSERERTGDLNAPRTPWLETKHIGFSKQRIGAQESRSTKHLDSKYRRTRQITRGWKCASAMMTRRWHDISATIPYIIRTVTSRPLGTLAANSKHCLPGPNCLCVKCFLIHLRLSSNLNLFVNFRSVLQTNSMTFFTVHFSTTSPPQGTFTPDFAPTATPIVHPSVTALSSPTEHVTLQRRRAQAYGYGWNGMAAKDTTRLSMLWLVGSIISLVEMEVCECNDDTALARHIRNYSLHNPDCHLPPSRNPSCK
ncbi:hypothetical protein CLF_100527 [Clonorchis sinensis]|uniref:Uncharacterized protein n=1 Tax=Clonorchis sinensis TaxID=79923 RepID=G7Y3N4_CLOSI|nr:hypothetical protein CLF_100527 [Clonorchis sinensis]